jgi:carnitine O-acetyltransferase
MKPPRSALTCEYLLLRGCLLDIQHGLTVLSFSLLPCVRRHSHGRTDVTRAVSPWSEAFVKKLGLRPKFDESNPTLRREKVDLLQRATTAHAKYTGLAAKASGVDRHFFGLSLMTEQGDEVPKLYADPVFLRAKKWRSSTSQLSHPRFNLWGYGEVVEDGVGLAYSILRESCVFCITARTSTGWTGKLAEQLEEALLEMRRLVADDSVAKSKL